MNEYNVNLYELYKYSCEESYPDEYAPHYEGGIAAEFDGSEKFWYNNITKREENDYEGIYQRY